MTIPRTCKRLIEVDFPIAEVSKHSAREKSIRHGHPSTLHLWWARRPLAACRAVLMGLLLPDPCDPDCPPEFKPAARMALAPVPCGLGPDDEGLRSALLKFIGDFANWDLSSNPACLKAARDLVKAAHGDEPPLVVDPFAGGGSIPLEALRLGCDAFASDLNPVACLILKVLLEDIPRHGPELADELRRAGEEIKKKAEEELREFYPADPDGSRPIAYLWARTVRCESPNCGCEIPLARSFWLSKKANRKRALKYRVVHDGSLPHIEFEVFTPKSDADVPKGTVSRANATCPACKIVLPAPRVREQLAAQRGGADVIFDQNGNRIGGAMLMAVVTVREGQQGRNYRPAKEQDYLAVWKAQKQIKMILDEWSRNGGKGLCPVPDESVDEWHHDVNRLPMYGARAWHGAFNARQKVQLLCFAGKMQECSTRDLVGILSLVLGRCVDYWSAHTVWALEGEFVAHTFGRQAIQMTWDYPEVVGMAETSGNWDGAVDWVARVADKVCAARMRPAATQLADAVDSPLADEIAAVLFTDPPYYDAIGYANLSDFFFVWLKRVLRNHVSFRDPFDLDNFLTPKTQEIIVNDRTTQGHGTKDNAFFENAMRRVFEQSRRVIDSSGISSVVFAHKSTEGWEALLTGMVQSGWVITASWPIATERPGRLRSQDSAALATSVHLVCRPRPDDAPIGDWGDILRELPNRIGDWMERLSREGVRGADLVFACIGPALELYSRHPRVETADGEAVGLGANDDATSEPARRGFLSYVWEIVGRMALEQVLGTAEAQARNGGAGALEEDSRLTALFLWTLQATNGGNGANGTPRQSQDTEEAEENEDEEGSSTGKKKTGFRLIYDVVLRFAQPLGIHLEDWENRIIETEKGVVRLLPVTERAKALFGEEGAAAMASHIEAAAARGDQMSLFGDEHPGLTPTLRGRSRSSRRSSGGDMRREATTLDRVHAAMLLQRSGRASALRALIESELDRSPDFLRLANALSALYPKDSEEKRLVDAMLLALPR